LSKKEELREQRYGTIINSTSKKQEKNLTKATREVIRVLEVKYPALTLEHEPQVPLSAVTERIQNSFPEVDTTYDFESSAMRPDGGLLYVVAIDGKKFPILISEKKNQGTTDLRELEGKPKQAKGNAIERLGKNVIGLRAMLADESIFPFVCFGDGCDFAEDSSILDRVVTIAIFGELNTVYLHDVANLPQFKRGTFFFRVEEWTAEEMADLCLNIADRAILYYFSKYGENYFLPEH
jgi:type II restriction enzyme